MKCVGCGRCGLHLSNSRNYQVLTDRADIKISDNTTVGAGDAWNQLQQEVYLIWDNIICLDVCCFKPWFDA